jgi:nicotinamidase-related amidase
MTVMLNTRLLIIDAQNDFTDYPMAGYKAALPVLGAYQDFLRLTELIKFAGSHIETVTATLDSHHVIDIAHNTSWLDHKGDIPQPFTYITSADLCCDRYALSPNLVHEDTHMYLLSYLGVLEQMGRQLVLWPPHCEIGTPGHNLNNDILTALRNWEINNQNGNAVNFILKGENIWTESYSALKAVIPYPGDPDTEINQSFLSALSESDTILVAGQASSHCVKETVEDILLYSFSEMKNKLVILTDCMSPVPGFETDTEKFFSHLQTQGIRLSTSVEMIAELLADTY